MTDLERRDTIRTELVHRRGATDRALMKGVTWFVSGWVALVPAVLVGIATDHALPMWLGASYLLGSNLFGIVKLLDAALERRRLTRELERLDREALPPARLLR